MMLRVFFSLATMASLLRTCTMAQSAFRGGGKTAQQSPPRNGGLSEWPDPCTADLISTDYDDTDTPTLKPFVLITRGRSGSTVLADTIEMLSNGYVDPVSPVTTELLTGSVGQRKKEFDPVKLVRMWLQNQCRRQQRVIRGDLPARLQKAASAAAPGGNFANSSKLIGFKWKMREGFTARHNALIARLFKAQQIRVVFFERNYLDFQISTGKHAIAPWLPPHCAPENSDYHWCMKQMKSLKVCLQVDYLPHLFEELAHESQLHLDALESAGVPFMRLWYKDLFQRDNHTAYWTQLMNFLGRAGPVTVDDLENAGSKKKTTSNNQRDVLINYDAVAAVIQSQTPQYEHFLHGDGDSGGGGGGSTGAATASPSEGTATHRCTKKNMFG